jgi:hypothetical protein
MCAVKDFGDVMIALTVAAHWTNQFECCENGEIETNCRELCIGPLVHCHDLDELLHSQTVPTGFSCGPDRIPSPHHMIGL